MATIAIFFTNGRYHATPWYRHVNEGAVEWPPSPWRLLRALIAVGFNKRGWPGAANLIPPDARRMLERLASVQPSYKLPSGGVAHTRHYMPIVEGSNANTTKVLDTFLRFSNAEEPLLVHWAVDLDAPEAKELESLAEGLAYLGRAESQVRAGMVSDPAPDETWSRPVPADRPLPDRWEITPLIAPITADAYADWRLREHAAAAERVQENGKKLTKRQQATLAEAFPADLLAALCMDTAVLQKAGWSQPPGSEKVSYMRPAHALEPAVPRPRPRRRKQPPVESALLALASDTARGQRLPLMTRSLPQMEILHDTLVGKLGAKAPRCEALTGRDRTTGQPLRGHGHARLLPLDLDRDGRMDHVLIYAPMRLDDLAQKSLARTTQTWGKGLPPVVVSLAGWGSMDLMREQLRDQRGKLLTSLATARTWESIAPLLLPRHVKKTGKNSATNQIIAECISYGFPEPAKVDVLDPKENVQRKFQHYVRARRPGHPQPPQRHPYCVRLHFDDPVQGPISLGYGAHFGLGVFGAVE